VLTGTGDRFMTDIDGPSLGDITKPVAWDRTITEGRRVMQRLVDLEMPIVAAVNGPASVHSEYVLLADIVVAADSTVFSDFPHLTFGIVPGDGIQLAWEEAIGLNRARYLAGTVRQRLGRRMAEATQLGLALEGLSAADLGYQ
jgi:enoyl-CoA hydratase/carnithine racemase